MSFSTVLKYGIISQGGVVTPSFPVSGLTAYWRFDETSGSITTDQVDTYQGTANNSRVLGSAGFHNNGVDFTQGNDYIGFDYPEFGSTMAEATISIWIKNPTTGIKNYIFSLFDTAQGDLAYELYIQENDLINVYLRGSTGSNQRTIAKYNVSALNLDDGDWHHLVVRQKASTNTIEFFIDGDKKTTTYDAQQPTDGFSDFSTTIAMGTRKVGNTYRTDLAVADCLFDELATWNRMLSDNEVTLLYNSGAGLFY